jgi:threonine synthase
MTEPMRYISTRGGIEPVDFQDAVRMGLADDGGLVIPERIPDVRSRLDAWRELDYPELAFEVMRLFTTDLAEQDLRELCRRTYGDAFRPEPAPVVRAGERHVLELWHGPTLSFKDIALQLLGNLFEHILAAQGGRLNILGATSGDTGSAAIAGVRGRDGIDIFMMHPRGRVSPIQQRQMTTVLDDNVHNIAIEGSFDDCQQIMKALAGDLAFKRRYELGAVNSVNWARVLAQIVYYFAGTFRVQAATGAAAVRVCVPTGNFGNILAGWYARRMGAPISTLVLATNENDILARFFRTGRYARGQVRQTLAPAMDIQVASNFERYLYYYLGEDPAELRRHMEQFSRTGSLEVSAGPDGVDPVVEAGSASREGILSAIRRCHEQTGYVLDPHTACGWAVVEALVPAGVGAGGGAGDDEPTLCVATAHPAKFPDAVREATGEDLAHHPDIDKVMDLPERLDVLPCDVEQVRRYIVDAVGCS